MKIESPDRFVVCRGFCDGSTSLLHFVIILSVRNFTGAGGNGEYELAYF